MKSIRKSFRRVQSSLTGKGVEVKGLWIVIVDNKLTGYNKDYDPPDYYTGQPWISFDDPRKEEYYRDLVKDVGPKNIQVRFYPLANSKYCAHQPTGGAYYRELRKEKERKALELANWNARDR